MGRRKLQNATPDADVHGFDERSFSLQVCTKLENTNVVANALFLVLSDTLGNPRDVSNFLQSPNVSFAVPRTKA